MFGFHGIGLPVPRGNPSEIQYLLRDEFITDRAAGAVNGTAAEPGPGTRNATGSNVAISSGEIVSTGTGTWGQAGWYLSPAIARAVGVAAIMRIKITGSALFVAGFTSTTDFSFSGYNNNAVTSAGGPVFSARGTSAATSPSLISISNSTYYWLAQILGVSGRAILSYSNNQWLLFWRDAISADASLYVGASVHSNALTEAADSIRAASLNWFPTPLVSDGFGSSFGTSDGAGHAETTGIGSGGGGQAWTQQSGMWGISSGKAIASSLLSGEAVATVPLSTANPFIGIDLARSGGNVGGVARWTDVNNHLRWYHDGTNHVLQQVVSGTPTTLITAAATYSANAKGWLWLNGTTARLYYNNALTGSTSSIDAGLTAADVGIRTTDTANTLDNFVAYAVGVEGQYNSLNQY